MSAVRENFRAAVVALLSLTILCGFVYPMVMTGLAELTMPDQARGSLIERQGRVIGSRLVGQHFDRPDYLWGRPSATSGGPYRAFDKERLTGSSGSNLGPTNPDLRAQIEARIAILRQSGVTIPAIPSDLVTTSASGLDPHISPLAALCQSERIAAARGVPVDLVRNVIEDHIEGRSLGVLGEPRVNVLLVNLSLDEAFPQRTLSGRVPRSP